MSPDEFMQQYGDETCELIVRVGWCWAKGRGSFPQVGNLYHAKARFDRALDVRSNEVFGQGVFNWLEWLTPKHLLGHPYGFAFKEGHLYRVLVRPALANAAEAGKSSSYYVEKILESDVIESRLDPYLEFTSEFCPEEVERDILVENGVSGSANVHGYFRAVVRYLAIADGKDDEPRACVGRLWIMEEARGDVMKTQLSDLGAYRVVVRERKDNPTSLFLVRVVKKLKDERFEPFREEYLKPVVIENSLGTFTLDRRYDWYEGSIDYLGKTCTVMLTVEEGSTDATAALAKLEELCVDLSSVDHAARAYAADQMLENASDWCEEELTREQFIERMDYPSITIEHDGSVGFMFDDGGMFAGHVIVVDMAADGSFERADIEG
ncbi:MAG: DUF2262 domain-containing protein [Coriobacteriales bacterium]|nr:DUF2262 domain-containing protein [Coriobacteriales bacterium]